MATVAQAKAAKEWGKPQGYVGNRGGWIYRNGKPVCQGWGELYHQNSYFINDELVVSNTAFSDFDALVNSNACYSPTLRTRDNSGRMLWRVCAIADAFDEMMRKRGDTRRAVRG